MTKITEVSYEEFIDADFTPPSTYFIKSAMGMYYFFHGRDRAKLQEVCDEMFGKNKYKLNSAKLNKSTRDLTARG